MNILTFPGSWSEKNGDISGIFVEQQIEAILNVDNEINISVLYTGGNRYGVSFSQPISFILSFLKSRKNMGKIKKGRLNVFKHPILKIYKFGLESHVKSLYKVFNKYFNQFFSEKPVDLIHVHFAHLDGFLAEFIYRKKKIPYIITEHSSPFPISSMYLDGNQLKSEYYSVFENAKCIIAVSEASKKKIESFGLQNVVYIPNLFNSLFSLKNYSLNKSKKFTFVAVPSKVCNPQKGIDILLESISIFLKSIKNDNVQFLIAGEGDKEKMKAMSIQRGIDKYVHFLGYKSQEELVNIYQTSHCFLMPSRHESFGIVCIEAMASGLPVVATKCGGPESIIKNRRVGVLVNNNNSYDFAVGMLSLYDNYAEYSPDYISAYCEDNFSGKVVANKILNLYKSFLRK